MTVSFADANMTLCRPCSNTSAGTLLDQNVSLKFQNASTHGHGCVRNLLGACLLGVLQIGSCEGQNDLRVDSEM